MAEVLKKSVVHSKHWIYHGLTGSMGTWFKPVLVHERSCLSFSG